MKKIYEVNEYTKKTRVWVARIIQYGYGLYLLLLIYVSFVPDLIIDMGYYEAFVLSALAITLTVIAAKSICHGAWEYIGQSTKDLDLEGTQARANEISFWEKVKNQSVLVYVIIRNRMGEVFQEAPFKTLEEEDRTVGNLEKFFAWTLKLISVIYAVVVAFIAPLAGFHEINELMFPKTACESHENTADASKNSGQSTQGPGNLANNLRKISD